MKLKKNTFAWIIKAKRANHMTRNGIYQDLRDAQDVFDDMPKIDNDGCGKQSDYEIVKVKLLGDSDE